MQHHLCSEHQALFAELRRATNAGGKTGLMAKKLSSVLKTHFEKEEKYALPPLTLLVAIANGKITKDMDRMIEVSAGMKKEFAVMKKEHKAISAVLKKFMNAAIEEEKMEFVRFAEKVIAHAREEDEILYPAAIIVGKYLKLKNDGN